jgi:hypothetical protein
LAFIGLLSAAACGGSSSDDNSFSGDSNEKVDGSGETLTLCMQGTNKKADSYFDDVSTAFKDETGADLDVQYVEWLGRFSPGDGPLRLPEPATAPVRRLALRTLDRAMAGRTP